MKTWATVGLLFAIATSPGVARADDVGAVVAVLAGENLPAELGVVDVHVPASIARLDVAPDQVVVSWPSPPHAGRASARVAIGSRHAWAQITIAARVPVAIAARDLAAGELIGEADVRRERRATTGAAAPAIVVGARATTAIAAGAIVTDGAIAAVPPIATGTEVAVRIRRAGFTIPRPAARSIAPRTPAAPPPSTSPTAPSSTARSSTARPSRSSEPHDQLALAPSLLAVAVAFAFAACVPHIAPYKPRHRHFDPGAYASTDGANGGGLYAGGGGFFDDGSASRVGDIVVIRIDEHENASRDATTKLDKQDDAKYGMPAAVGLLAALQKKYPSLNPSQLLATDSSVKFSGSGSIERKGALTATLPVRVAQVLPNGNLYVEGHKVVMVGEEEHHLYISGIVRRLDIADDDTVPSSRIADAEIEYTGRGDVSDQQRRGWLSRVIGKLWPF